MILRSWYAGERGELMVMSNTRHMLREISNANVKTSDNDKIHRSGTPSWCELVSGRIAREVAGRQKTYHILGAVRTLGWFTAKKRVTYHQVLVIDLL